MVLRRRNPVTFRRDPHIVYESERGTPDQRPRAIAVEFPNAHGNRVVLIEVFSREEPEQLVANNWAPQGTAELFTGKARRGLAPIECRGQPLERLVAEEEELRPVHLIGPLFCSDVDDAGRGTTDFCRVFIGGNLKLSDSIFWEVHQGSAHDFVIVVSAIDDDVAASSVRACRGNL